MKLRISPSEGRLERPTWIEDAQQAVRFVPQGARVLDFDGEGLRLSISLPDGCAWVSPALESSGTQSDHDLVVAFGLPSEPSCALDRLRRLRAFDKPVVVSLRGSAASTERSQTLCHETLANLVQAAGFARMRMDANAGRAVVRLEPVAPNQLAERQVWVLSYSNVGNFGDRLGQHLLSQVLPPNARIRRLHHRPWNAPPEGEPDLLILGIGNSLFQPLLTQSLVNLMDRAKATVGIFGTQYREAIDRRHIGAVLDRLDVWWARHETDKHIFGRGRANVRHLGDWMIDAFPLACPSTDETLTVGAEIWADRPLDRTIELIQAHSRVFSSRVHPLLCALTSAETVAYREQREIPSLDSPSGKFRSMLLDIFGQDFPEGEFWQVDAGAVVDYKTKVRANIEFLREDLARLIA